mmetsp:Transcript_20858/g.43999  ORF Transcript_20858/g.43999 Transcript_20858/m.43999 type:complete len:241 (-) Transcript_20858:325-1047(-)
MPLCAAYSPDVLVIEGGGTRYLVGSLRSPSYCIRPTKLTFGTRSRLNLLNSSPPSKALVISSTRSERKLKMTTASLSSIGPTGLPSPSTTTNGPMFWSDTSPSLSALYASIALVFLVGASPRTCARHPFSTMPQSASYRSIVTTMRPPPDAILASQPSSLLSISSSSEINRSPELSGTSRPSVSTWQRIFFAPSFAACCTIWCNWLHRECTPPSERRPMKWMVFSAKDDLTYCHPSSLKI